MSSAGRTDSSSGARTSTELATLGIEIYPRTFARADTITALVEAHGGETRRRARGRAARDDRRAGASWRSASFGKANFLVLSDGHAKIQVYIRQDSLPALDFQIFKLLDFGDWIGVEGQLFRTKTNELTIWASRAALPRQVPAAAAGEMARPHRRRDPLPPALPRSHRQPRLRAGCSRRAAASSPRSASS